MERVSTVYSDDSDTEIVVVSDTVRLRRSRTPSNSGDTSVSRERANTTAVKSLPLNLPDLLPSTFRLAEQSSLFSNISDDSVASERGPQNGLSKSYVVSTSEVSHITLEKVQFFEPEHAETVNIVDLSEDNASDTSEGFSTSRDGLQFIANESKLSKDDKPNKITFNKLKTERVNSFYESDKECNEEPLVFSEDEDIEIEHYLVHLTNLSPTWFNIYILYF